jgi:hypothetical protein
MLMLWWKSATFLERYGCLRMDVEVGGVLDWCRMGRRTWKIRSGRRVTKIRYSFGFDRYGSLVFVLRDLIPVVLLS